MSSRSLLRSLGSLVVASWLAACGQGAGAPTLSTPQALTGTAELLEFVPASTRRELYRDVVRQAASQASSAAGAGALLFPVFRDERFVALPAPEAKGDLLGGTDAGASASVSFDTRGDGFSEDRRDAFQGLSEREAAELVARSLLARWGVTSGEVRVMRASGAPYAAAYLDGVLRLNPAFVYMAAAPASP